MIYHVFKQTHKRYNFFFFSFNFKCPQEFVFWSPFPERGFNTNTKPVSSLHIGSIQHRSSQSYTFNTYIHTRLRRPLKTSFQLASREVGWGGTFDVGTPRSKENSLCSTKFHPPRLFLLHLCCWL